MRQPGFKWYPEIPLILLLSIVVTASCVIANEDTELPFVRIPEAENLQKSGLIAATQCKPILLEFSAAYCSYCRQLEEEILKPILRNRDYDSRALIQKVKIDSHLKFIDFTGDKTDAETLASRYRVRVTPTLLFVNKDGKEIAERMIGVNSLDYYGAYLDENLALATSQLTKNNGCGH